MYLLTKINWNALRKVPSTGSLAKLSLATTEGLNTCTSLGHAKAKKSSIEKMKRKEKRSGTCVGPQYQKCSTMEGWLHTTMGASQEGWPLVLTQWKPTQCSRSRQAQLCTWHRATSQYTFLHM